MAKEDFCFTYYDGDAARDKAHMTRLERGAYDDIISAQRKRGHLSIDDIKRVLSKDFDLCWASLEWILKKDEQHKFFIEWVDKSIEKMRQHSEKQKEKAGKRWKNNATDIPQHTNGIDSAMPLEDENGNEDGKGNVLEGGVGETFEPLPETLIGEMKAIWKKHNPKTFISTSENAALLEISKKILIWTDLSGPVTEKNNKESILRRWGEVVTHCKADGHLQKYSITQVNKHFSSVTQSFKSNATHQQSFGKTAAKNGSGKSAGAYQLLDSLRADIGG